MTNTNSIFPILEEANTFAILSHQRPDGDAISSSFAMFWYLLYMGKEKQNIDVIIPEFLSDFSFNVWSIAMFSRWLFSCSLLSKTPLIFKSFVFLKAFAPL